ncbi:hypothetical protein [Edaphobacter modestus]|uniref:Uncharacterized protein n=1 Tax=Edaphobacter modestus TaxID=388466 RepID=A0A4Q7YYS5_9BACT|nr:hypothetical protein [Edaphobacter modestus]RZU42299.1 hypothetical protein BDD14_3859 [Edaphobacter modestus]
MLSLTRDSGPVSSASAAILSDSLTGENLKTAIQIRVENAALLLVVNSGEIFQFTLPPLAWRRRAGADDGHQAIRE